MALFPATALYKNSIKVNKIIRNYNKIHMLFKLIDDHQRNIYGVARAFVSALSPTEIM